MESEYYFKAIYALIFVMGLIGISLLMLKKFIPMPVFNLNQGKNKRISVEEVKMLDARRRVVLLRKDKDEYLILLGVNSDIVLQSANLNEVPKITKLKPKKED